MRAKTYLCTLAIAALIALLISLAPAVFLSDLAYPSHDDPSANAQIRHWLSVVVLPPNFVAIKLGLQHLEYVHVLEQSSGGSPAHDLGGCRCSPSEMRNSFLAVAWPFWFLVVASALFVANIAVKLSGAHRPAA